MDQKQMCNCEKSHPGKIIGISIMIKTLIVIINFRDMREPNIFLIVSLWIDIIRMATISVPSDVRKMKYDV